MHKMHRPPPSSPHALLSTTSASLCSILVRNASHFSAVTSNQCTL